MKNRLELEGNLGVFQFNFPSNLRTSFIKSLTLITHFVHLLPESHNFMRMPIPYFSGPFCC